MRPGLRMKIGELLKFSCGATPLLVVSWAHSFVGPAHTQEDAEWEVLYGEEGRRLKLLTA